MAFVREYDLMVGFLDQEQPFERFAEVVSNAAGQSWQRILEGERRALGVSTSGRFEIYYEPSDFEPFSTHPYRIGLSLYDLSGELELANRIYDALAASGAYRVILLGDDDFVRGTHYTEGEWEEPIPPL
ncbi:hypothetical protein AB0J86_05815 [Micromonospora sp. NPDC049559]|uniref:hypothetical protein n=1 Tax=Micromonospora sp. NPDC049559 TaxID=3155923 RepID=UPI0034281D07